MIFGHRDDQCVRSTYANLRRRGAEVVFVEDNHLLTATELNWPLARSRKSSFLTVSSYNIPFANISGVLTLYYFATRHGFPVRFHYGVHCLGERLQGHACLSLGGRPFLEEDNPGRSYALICSFPGPERAAAAAGPRAINS